MIKKYHRLKYILSFIILMGYNISPLYSAGIGTFLPAPEQDNAEDFDKKEIGGTTEELRQLNTSLQRLLMEGYIDKSRKVVDTLLRIIGNKKISDEKTLSESYYFIGVFYSFMRNNYKSIEYLNLAVELKERNNIYDERFAKALYNLGVVYNDLGDFNKQEDCSLKSLEVEKKIYGESSPYLIRTYSSLITAYMGLYEYEKSINLANTALIIANNNLKVVNPEDLASLYYNLGVLNMLLANYSKANIYLYKSETIYKNEHLKFDEDYINLLNSTAITYGELGFFKKSEEYYERGINLALSSNSPLAYNTINSYAIMLGNAGKKLKGLSLLGEALERAKRKFGEDSRRYIEVLYKYANYLREFKIDNKKSVECYLRCMDYLNENQQDLYIKLRVYIGFSLSLSEAGEHYKALEIIQSLLYSDYGNNQSIKTFDNPVIGMIKPDRRSLMILKTKYLVLWEIYRKTQEQKPLEAASNTAELLVSLLEKVRINISEEESRLLLGDKYRDSYLNAIRDFNLLYSKTSDSKFLEKAFEYSEKCKVAGLLTSTRELKATQFQIPSNIANLEKKLQRDISLFNARIEEESVTLKPDTIILNNWKEALLKTTRMRDSLISVFEKQFPDYYSVKYNTQVADLKDIRELTGRKGNYINYIMADTLLYVFITNRKYRQMLALPIDSSFSFNIRQFRDLLAVPSPSGNARTSFENYQSVGYELYKVLIMPIRQYFISEKLLISTDNILSFLPFETIPASSYSGDRILYNKIAYLMNDFDISYTYSATFMAENIKRNFSIGNKVIAFAPNYPESIDIQSVLMNRQAGMGKLKDLPYARQEAEYVSEITGGKLFENDEARESVYKAESGKFDIIHLAMHAVLNDNDPMHSILLFSPENDNINDSYLKTYEIYGIPLKSKMVVLSSCNTGSGTLNSGEGILSLARGFMYSGSESVVMSMWEIEDRSGTQIVKMFYDNLRRGNSKSLSLRKARITYLENADQLHSHPYFWSTLVIYGDNSPLYFPNHLFISFGVFLCTMIAFFMFHSKKRKYS